jgi:hypothetical protein
MSFSSGDTFLLRYPVQSEKMHLYIVICAPFRSNATVLIVPLNSTTILTDNTVIMELGDHPFIKRSSSVSYNLIQVMAVADLENMESNRDSKLQEVFKRHEPASAELVKRIVDGALKSERTPTGIVADLKIILGQ